MCGGIFGSSLKLLAIQNERIASVVCHLLKIYDLLSSHIGNLTTAYISLLQPCWPNPMIPVTGRLPRHRFHIWRGGWVLSESGFIIIAYRLSCSAKPWSRVAPQNCFGALDSARTGIAIFANALLKLDGSIL